MVDPNMQIGGGRVIDTSKWRVQVNEPDGIAGVLEADTVEEILNFVAENEDLYREFWIVAPDRD